MITKGKEKQSFEKGLTREGVFEHVAAMKKDGDRFVVKPYIKKYEGNNAHDRLLCGGYCYGLMFMSRDTVDCFILRMSPETAECLLKSHKITPAETDCGNDWYRLPVDGSLNTNEEIFRILDACYDFTLNEFYLKRRRKDVCRVLCNVSQSG